MQKIVLGLIAILILGVVGQYTLIGSKEKVIQKKEAIVSNMTKNEFGSIVSKWVVDKESKLFIKKINIDQMNEFFVMIKEVYGSCKIEKEPVCLSQERFENSKDAYATEFGASITCTYEVNCEKKNTTGSLIFRPNGKDTYQIGRFSLQMD